MGCGTCKSECGREDGCGSRKAAQKLVLDELVIRLYPARTWGQPDEAACFRAGPSEGEVRRLAQSLSIALRAPAFFRPGAPDDLCSFIYVLCVGREPALIGLLGTPHLGLSHLGQLSPGQRIDERYLRIALSSCGRLAAVQEVVMELRTDPDAAPEGMAVLRELPRPGVFDPHLLKRFQKTTDFLLAHGIEHLDMGLLDLPAAQFGLSPGDYPDRFGTHPGLFNFFFHAEPVQTAAASYLELTPHFN